MFKAAQWSLLLLAVFLPLATYAAGVDMTADHMVRNSKGMVTATGSVHVKRADDETLDADKVRYDAENHKVHATGKVIIRTSGTVITSDDAEMDTISKRGELHHANVQLLDGGRLSSTRVERLDEFNFIAKHAQFTNCPVDHEAWTICATSAHLDKKNGTLTAYNARLEFGGVPVFYTPYWQHATRRKSGVLMPLFASGKRRGTELTLPLYLAPSPGWDATFTPHWMSARGFMGETELRHVSTKGHETIQFQGIRDTLLDRNRSQIKGKASWQLPYQFHLSVDADHVSDHDYLADFSPNAKDASTQFIYSKSTLSWQNQYNDMQLWAQHQQNLISTDNKTTLQIMPRLETHTTLPILDKIAVFHFDQQSTRFARRTGLDGWRTDLHPYLDIPWNIVGNGLTAKLHFGGSHARYWLKNTTLGKRAFRNSGEFGAELNAIFEHVTKNHHFRHTIEPTVRYDIVHVTDQTGLPNFDSGFAGLSLGNLLSNNRFSGHDRIENMQRISMMIASRLQSKPDDTTAPRTLAQMRMGIAYDLRRQSTDPAFQARPTRPFSNLLGDLTINPTRTLSLNARGQYDPAGRFWPTAQGNIDWTPNARNEFHATYILTDTRFDAPISQAVQMSAKLGLTSKWQATGSWHYDMLLKTSQQTRIGLAYHHCCFDVSFEAFRIFRPTGTSNISGASDFGVSVLIALKGIGSFGQSKTISAR